MAEKITMTELFSGIGAQERALRQLKLPYEIKNTCDCDKDAVLSYAAMRWDLNKEMETFDFPSQDKMIEELQAKNLGYDFANKKHTITSRTPLTKLKQYYIADKLSRNLGDISKVERLPYVDFVTYSYPCTDLSVAGKGEGMVNKCDKCGCSWAINFENPKNNNICPDCGNIDIKSTRSGLLGQVQRLLTVSHNEGTLPKYLLLENVKNLVGSKFKPQFDAWINWLDLIGYNTYYKVLNSKNYGIPQNRERIFAISIRKDVDVNGFAFPEQITLKNRLKNVLERNVDEKYYLPDDRLEKILKSSAMIKKKEDDIKVVGNYMPSNHDASRVVDIDGIAPTVKENHGTVTAIAEPFIVASRGRNPDNPSDRTVGAPTEQRLEPNFSGCSNCLTSVGKDNYVCEPQVLRAERTEYGKAIRKQYESGEINEKIGNMREMKPRTDGVSNTITTLVKDNYVYEPQIIQNPHGFNKGQVREDCPSITSSYFQENNYVAEPIIYDDYNSRISADQDAINTLTCNCGASAERNGVKIIEQVVIDDIYNNRDPRIYNETSPTLRSERYGLKVADQIEVEPDIIMENIVFPVMVRTYVVDCISLCQCLRRHKDSTNLSNKDIAAIFSVPLTKVEHWFRQDDCFAIPDPDIWPKLKELLNITTDEFDESIMTFEIKDGVYDKANRCYHIEGIAPTLTVASANEKIIEPIDLKCLNSKGGRNGVEGLQPSLCDRVYDSNGCATACTTSTHFMPGYLVSEGIRWRIRKLTPKECLRLMNFTDSDYDAISQFVSSSAIYKQAGNSIVVACLIALMSSLFIEDGHKAEVWTQYALHFDD